MNQSLLSTKDKVFESAGIPSQQIQYWNQLQARYRKHEFIFIEYEQEFSSKYIWRCYLESNKSMKSHQKIKTAKFEGNKFNAELARQFIDKESYGNTYWDSFMQDIKWLGYFIPVDDFTYFTSRQFESELNHSYLLKNHFKSTEYLINVKKDSIHPAFKNDPIAILGIWNFIVFYSNFLYSCYENDLIGNKPNITWHTRNYSVRNFHSYLPSRQLSVILMIVVESGFSSVSSTKRIDRLIKKTHQSVQDFFTKHYKEITNWVRDKEGVLFSENMKLDFVRCCRKDVNFISVIEILSTINQIKLESYLPIDFKTNVYKQLNKNLFNRIQNKLAEFSILDILWFDPTGMNLKPKRYIPLLSKYQFNTSIDLKELRNSIIDSIDVLINSLPLKDKEELQNEVIKKWNSHLVNVANTFTVPMFTWTIKQGETIPQWNIFQHKSRKKHIAAYYAKQENLTRQKRRFNENLFNLQNLKKISEVEKFISESDPFFNSDLREKWTFAVTQHLNTIKGLQSFRERKMIELGIKKENDLGDFRTEIWLNEMLKIEEEISKYIPFVKKAFNAALPIRKTVEFNSDRHDQSGVEFDPTTINDQNKWLRGQVMKTLKTKIKLGEIEQINAFCLDYSGSMKHDRMRNLFKVLYLMVLGLEDRKSYDAFHFFNTSFIEGSNFSEEFTHRSLLFNILSQVSEIKMGEVKYGGNSGTNIGDGVLKCHNRIHAFKKEMEAKKPGSKFVCSLFVITDGEPSVGIIDLDELNDFIEEKRNDGDIAIKGIYIKNKEDEYNFMKTIFGEDEYVETVEFGEAVNKFVTIMTNTYKAQRKDQRWKTKRESLKTNN